MWRKKRCSLKGNSRRKNLLTELVFLVERQPVLLRNSASIMFMDVAIEICLKTFLVDFGRRKMYIWV